MWTEPDRRRGEIPKVTRIIREELISFFRWQNALEVARRFRNSGNPWKQSARRSDEKRQPVQARRQGTAGPRHAEDRQQDPSRADNRSEAGTESHGHSEDVLNRVRALRELFGISRNGGGGMKGGA